MASPTACGAEVAALKAGVANGGIVRVQVRETVAVDAEWFPGNLSRQGEKSFLIKYDDDDESVYEDNYEGAPDDRLLSNLVSCHYLETLPPEAAQNHGDEGANEGANEGADKGDDGAGNDDGKEKQHEKAT